jgi:serpin B
VRIAAPAIPDGDLTQLAADNRHFAVNLYQAIRQTPGNLVFSPESISIALAMTFGGAAGETATQMAATLQFTLPAPRLHAAFDALDLSLTTPKAGQDPNAFQLRIADALWAQQGFTILPAYLDLLATNSGAGVHLVDFNTAAEPARLTINQWLSDQTAQKIPELLPTGSLLPNTRLVLTNAVYFKGDWASPFMPNSPDGLFHTTTATVNVPMMRANGSVTEWSGDGYQAAALPYVGAGASMIVIVPDAGTFDAVEAGLTGATLDAILLAADSGPGTFSLPRFKFKQDLSLSDVLSGMGMPDAFDGQLADLSGIDGMRDLYIQKILHQALIAVDEKGTEAAAATAVIIGETAGMVGVMRNLVVDRPFLFAIRDNATQSILFLGRVLDPSM